MVKNISPIIRFFLFVHLTVPCLCYFNLTIIELMVIIMMIIIIINYY